MRRIAGRVWLYPEDPNPDVVKPSVTIIADERGSVIVDAGQSPAHARAVQSEMARLDLPAAHWLIYTHHHWDHVWGACAWPDVRIVAGQGAGDLLAVEAARPWSHDYLRQEATANPLLEKSYTARAAAMVTFDGFSLRLPDLTVIDKLDLPVGVTVRHVGGRHSPDSVVVEVPDSRVLVLGDCYYPPPFHLRKPTDTLDLELIGGLRDDSRFDWYVEGHAPPWPPDRPWLASPH